MRLDLFDWNDETTLIYGHEPVKNTHHHDEECSRRNIAFGYHMCVKTEVVVVFLRPMDIVYLSFPLCLVRASLSLHAKNNNVFDFDVCLVLGVDM